MAFLELEGIAKSFGDTTVLTDISLAVEEGETLVLLGQSGSGKTTLLRIIAGFEPADAGRVQVGGRSISHLPPAERNFGMVFQHYALFPHLTVGENVAFGLEAHGAPKDSIPERVGRALELVDLAGLGGRGVDAISGGQQQRVALARALAPEPELLLLDEPLSNLDPELRERTREELAATLRRIGITAVWVTHEQDEAFDVGSRVATLNSGRLEQVAAPEELYRRPATAFVARFVGRASVLSGRLVAPGRAQIEVAGRPPLDVPVHSPGARSDDVGAPVDIFVRPEAWELMTRSAPSGEGELAGEVLSRRFTGRDNLVRVRLGSGVEIEVACERDLAVGDTVRLRVRSDGAAPAAFRSDPESG